MMTKMMDIEWFKKEMTSCLDGYELRFRFFENGDFGTLNQIEFNSNKIGGNIDFWGLDWLGIFVWSYETEKVLLNVLIKPQQCEEKEKAFKRLLEFLNEYRVLL